MGDLKLRSLPNFRRLDGTNLYRSSRPDKLSMADMDKLRSLGIQSVLDLRSTREYPHTNGPMLMDDHFMPISAYPRKQKGSAEPKIEYRVVSRRGTPRGGVSNTVVRRPDMGVHFVVDLLSWEYGLAVYMRAGICVKLLLAILYIVDIIFRTHFFVQCLVRYVINIEGLYGQYRDMLKYAKVKFYTALRLLAESENSPTLVCCTYGEDRAGLMVALLLRLMGRDREYVANDYSKSAAEMEKLQKEIRNTLHYYKLHPTFASADYYTMMKLLDFIDTEYGSVEQYLDQIGINRELQAKIIQNLTPTEGEMDEPTIAT